MQCGGFRLGDHELHQFRRVQVVGHLSTARNPSWLACAAPLYTEPRVAVLPATHRLAGKEEVTEADLAGEPLLWHGDTSTQPTRRPHPNAGYLVRGVDETLEHVAAGRSISFLARSATVFYSHPDVTYVPVPDLAPDQVCLAVAASRISPVVDDFFLAAQAAAEITAECGNYQMWQLGGDAIARLAERVD